MTTATDDAFTAYLHRLNVKLLYEWRHDALTHGTLTIEQFHQLCEEYHRIWGRMEV